ncbi:MAG: spermidine/putrescine ABC transporter permease, partial [Oscillospiraceae bacterium]|nr:spermidine/putrescine ABC transporter permease [Oscillospiraceae bacterium]
MKKRSNTAYLLLLPFFIIMALVLISIWNVAVQSFGYIPTFGLTELTLDYYLSVFQQEEFLSSFWVSLRIALFSATFAAIFGVLLCYALIKLNHNRGRILYMVRLPILMPHAVVAVFVINIFSQTGLLARIAYALGLLSDYNQFP